MLRYRIGNFDLSDYIGREYFVLLREVFIEEGRKLKILDEEERFLSDFPIFEDGPLKRKSFIKIKYYDEKKLIDEIVIIKYFLRKIAKEKRLIENLKGYLDKEMIMRNKEKDKEDIYKKIIKILLEDKEIEKNIENLKINEEGEILKEIMLLKSKSSYVPDNCFNLLDINNTSNKILNNLREIIKMLKNYYVKLTEKAQEIKEIIIKLK